MTEMDMKNTRAGGCWRHCIGSKKASIQSKGVLEWADLNKETHFHIGLDNDLECELWEFCKPTAIL